MRLETLPGWTNAEDELVRENADRWRAMSVAERWREVEACARDVLWAVRASPFPERVLGYEDPLPESTLAALRRLRADRRG
jgi:hypothetical protein